MNHHFRNLGFSLISAFIFLSGCATLGQKPSGLLLTVEPSTVHPGDIVRARAIAPAGTRRVTGRLDLPGSPQLPLKTADGGQTWSFITQIPLASVWAPGRYRAIVEGVGPDGEPLRGQTWIQAQ